MNERIRELAIQSGMSLYNNSDEFFGRQDNFDFRKFAELILKEVFNACDMCEPDHNPEYSLCEMFGIDHNWRILDEQ